MLLLAEMLGAEEAHRAGFITRVVAPEALDATAAAICERIAQHAPLTLQASKETIRRIAAGDRSRNDDLIRLCYGSEDFRRGVAAVVANTGAAWTGR